jgi:hypothetical protein
MCPRKLRLPGLGSFDSHVDEIEHEDGDKPGNQDEYFGREREFEGNKGRNEREG